MDKTYSNKNCQNSASKLKTLNKMMSDIKTILPKVTQYSHDLINR